MDDILVLFDNRVQHNICVIQSIVDQVVHGARYFHYLCSSFLSDGKNARPVGLGRNDMSFSHVYFQSNIDDAVTIQTLSTPILITNPERIAIRISSFIFNDCSGL
jgi:hypothetical protein